VTVGAGEEHALVIDAAPSDMVRDPTATARGKRGMSPGRKGTFARQPSFSVKTRIAS
jgi:hypothetical protein